MNLGHSLEQRQSNSNTANPAVRGGRSTPVETFGEGAVESMGLFCQHLISTSNAMSVLRTHTHTHTSVVELKI